MRKNPIKKPRRVVKPMPCAACGNMPECESDLDNHNKTWWLYNCPICEPDGPAKFRKWEAAEHWNDRQKSYEPA